VRTGLAPPAALFVLKEVELKILANRRHGVLGGDFLNIVIDFFSRKLEGKPLEVKVR
jgi:hypothetical protein